MPLSRLHLGSSASGHFGGLLNTLEFESSGFIDLLSLELSMLPCHSVIPIRSGSSHLIYPYISYDLLIGNCM